MKNIGKLRFLITLLLLSFILSGCYTLIGYSPDAIELSKEGKKDREYEYRNYDNEPYRQYYFDSYGVYSLYGWNWFPSYYSYYPYWNDYYWHDDYDDYYAPEKKPETRKRDITEFGRSQRLEKWDNQDSDRNKRDTDRQSGKNIEEKRSSRKYRDEE